MAATRAERERIVIGSADTLSWFHPADDPNVGYGFCSTCGSSLFWRDSEESSTWSICAGTLDQPTGLSTEIIYFASEAGDYHRLDPRIVQLATE